MTSKKNRARAPKEINKKFKKKTSVLVQESVDYIDYKDINLLRRFMSDRAKIRARRVTGNDAQQQREVARAIKNAREMALLPYTNRVTTQRTSRDRGPGGPGDFGRWPPDAFGGFRGAPWGDGAAPWGWGAPPRAGWGGPLPPPGGFWNQGPINYWGYDETPIWDQGQNGWGFYFFGIWIPL